jgi:Ca2+-binding RTX toxin-like protein
MYGGLGSDVLLGGDGNDSMAGDVGSNPSSSAGSPDHMNGGPGNDILYGQGGNDCSDVAGDHATCGAANLVVGVYYAQMEGGSGIDRLHGGPGTDRLDGGPESGNQLVGGTDDNDFCSFGPGAGDARDKSCELPSKGTSVVKWAKWTF